MGRAVCRNREKREGVREEEGHVYKNGEKKHGCKMMGSKSRNRGGRKGRVMNFMN